MKLHRVPTLCCRLFANIKKRMQASREAILGGENISQVYERFGFRDYSSFYRAFRREYGMSPKEYREERLR